MNYSFGGIQVARQVRFPVSYKGKYIGDYYADLVVEGEVLVELKCVDRLGNVHLAQCLNQLKASGLSVCLLVNFDKPKVEFRRVVLDFLGGGGSGSDVFDDPH